MPWDSAGRIPVALITGTNGKTTTTRLLARVAREAGKKVGMSSSDTVTIGTNVIEQGDWTGPAAARIVLRSHEVDFAVLETARGGILRRGLAVDEADAAIITNVSEDHSGYGIDDLDQMAQVKAVTVRAVKKGGTVVLNAHDRRLVALIPSLAAEVTLFADLDREDAGAREAILAVTTARRSSPRMARSSKIGAEDVTTARRIADYVRRRRTAQHRRMSSA